jgi:hypothetical protein
MSDAATETAPRLPSLQAGGSVKAIVPQDFDGAWRIAVAVTKAGMAPKGLESPEKAMVAIMHGMEVGLTPMAALQSIAVVNGRPTIWGDGAIGLIRASGKFEWIKEWVDGTGDQRIACCQVKRKGEPESSIYKFSVDQAKKAGLWGKQGPWTQYPDRMLSVRPRSWALRDTFADILRGLGITEEVQDFQPMRDVSPQASHQPPKPPAPPEEVEDQTIIDGEIVIETEQNDQADEVASATEQETAGEEIIDDNEFFEKLEEALAVVSDAASLEEVWSEFDPMARFTGKPGGETNQSIAKAIRKRAEKRIGGAA